MGCTVSLLAQLHAITSKMITLHPTYIAHTCTHLLARVPPVRQQHVVVGPHRKLVHHPPDPLQGQPQRRRALVVRVLDALNMALGDDERVPVRDGVDVQEGTRQLVLLIDWHVVLWSGRRQQGLLFGGMVSQKIDRSASSSKCTLPYKRTHMHPATYAPRRSWCWGRAPPRSRRRCRRRSPCLFPP